MLAGNPLTGGLGRIDLGYRATLLLVTGVALLVTIVTAGADVALVAQFTGVALGVIVGRRRLLNVS
jgi:hypothetical protein